MVCALRKPLHLSTSRKASRPPSTAFLKFRKPYSPLKTSRRACARLLNVVLLSSRVADFSLIKNSAATGGGAIGSPDETRERR
ncbi:hypothetical protein GIV26_12390 [Pseudomonas sp. PA-1-3F]|nr:hypothetical protein [Pseudomonas sp. PA-1-3F]